MESLDLLRSFSELANMYSSSTPPPPDSVSSGSFSNLILTAEKLMKNQAAMRTELDLANCKLKISIGHVYNLEERLQKALNENAKLRGRQKEDEKLWMGLNSKFSSTKALSDQLTETLLHLASQVQDAEKDKDLLESRFNTSSEAIETLNQQLQDMSFRLGCAESRAKELEELKFEKEHKDMVYLNEQRETFTASLIEKKDAVITNLEPTSANTKLYIENFNSQVEKLRLELASEDYKVKYLVSILENLDREKTSVQLSADKYLAKLVSSEQDVKKLDEFVHSLGAELAEMDKKNLIFMANFDKLSGLYDTCFMLLQKDRDLVSDHAKRSFDQLQGELSRATAEKETLESAVNKLNGKIVELQNDKQSLICQLSGIRCSTSQTIDKLESEAKQLVVKNAEAESVISKLKEEIETLLERLKTSEDKKQELSSKLSSIQMENKEKSMRFQADALRQSEKLATLQKESESHQLQADLLAKEVNQLQTVIEDKVHLIHQFNENENRLKQQIVEDKELLATAESKLEEANKQYDLMLESKHLELSRQLKDLSQRNDQAINDMRRKYETEKQEIVNAEKEKVEKTNKELSIKYDKELSYFKEEPKRQLLTIHEEHASPILREENENKELNLKAKNDQELRQREIHAENELKEEEGQKALVQLHWEVMSENQAEEKEVDSYKLHSASKDSLLGGSKRNEHIRVRAENEEEQAENHTYRSFLLCQMQESPFVKVTATPASKTLKKVQKAAHCEYEVETNNSRVTKRRKTRNNAMFEGPQRRITRATSNLTTQIVAKEPQRRITRATSKLTTQSVAKVN